ncbi:MAG: hypothetical protein JRI95_12740 [Deltaproteobacteria bacterium]|nr:hypothetical protein [Deltaproteobacteria bacterium]MBW2086581.1 hypothetical protein [Deltaproteobacteria bacterium]
MRRLHTLLTITLFLLLVPYAAMAQPMPKAVTPEIDFDFGKVKAAGQTLKHDFVIANHGQADLVIASVVPG